MFGLVKSTKIWAILSLFVYLFMGNITYAESIPYKAYQKGVGAYQKYQSKSKYIIIVDFDLPSTSKRLWIINISTKSVIYNTWVTHGEGSGEIYATSFSNQPESHKSSLGAYVTAEAYEGRHGLSRRLDGLERSNNRARDRDIVIHGADYIGEGKTGRSWGCFAVPEKEVKYIVKLVGEGTILYAYHS